MISPVNHPRIGVYVCHCGSNIAGRVDVEEVARWARETLGAVVLARDYKFMCSSLGQRMIEEDIKEHRLDRVVIAACSPHLHEKTFRQACSNGGLNPYLMDMCNIREHCSWIHKNNATATEKAKALVSASARRVRYKEPLEPIAFPDRHYEQFLDNTRLLFPNIKLLFMVRDPLATIWSMSV